MVKYQSTHVKVSFSQRQRIRQWGKDIYEHLMELDTPERMADEVFEFFDRSQKHYD